MKRILSIIFICIAGVHFLNAQDLQLRHVVSFSFKEEATEEQVADLIKDFIDLQNKIPEIQSFEWGTDNSPEGLQKGLTHCFILTFKNEEDRDIYLPHPAHKAFGKKNGPIIKDVFVIDFYVKEDF